MNNVPVHHSHPKTGVTIFGSNVGAGDKLQEDDVYPAANGKWLKIPKSIVGEILRENHPMEIVRPERLAITEGERT